MSHFKVISKNEALFLLEFIDNCRSCQTLTEISGLVTDLANETGFERAVYGQAKLDLNGSLTGYNVINISYPEEWLTIYRNRSFQRIDPIYKENFSKFTVQYWADTYQQFGKPLEFITIKESFNLRNGYTCGTRNNSRSQGSIFSLAGKVHDDPLIKEILDILYPHIDIAFQAVIKQRKIKSYNISTRETAVLNWIKKGKSSWDISVLLNISESTVKYHVNNIMKKLDAVSRSQALAIAMTAGLIDID